MRAPATATAQATRNEAVMPLMNALWVTFAMSGGGSGVSMLAAFDAYADQVAPAVAGHWR
jgi:hypothetical protein